jgi:uncharacterized spore protein YtfJ
MDTADVLRSLGDRLGTAATVKSVYGDPIHAEGRTVVPVAKLSYGFGAGGGARREQAQEGGGGGAGLSASPAGVLEISASGTRFIAFCNRRDLGIGFGLGLLLGAMLFSRSKRVELTRRRK